MLVTHANNKHTIDYVQYIICPSSSIQEHIDLPKPAPIPHLEMTKNFTIPTCGSGIITAIGNVGGAVPVCNWEVSIKFIWMANGS